MKGTICTLFVLLVLITTSQLSAQIKSANRLYNRMQYAKAIPFYTQVIGKKKSEDKPEAKIKLADCYRLTNQPQKAELYYSEALSHANDDLEFHFNYANVLRTLGQYNKAKEHYLKFLEIDPNSIKALHYSKYCDDIKAWSENGKTVNIENIEALNSPYSEFSPTLLGKDIVFVSDRMVDELSNNNYYWTGNGYLDLYSTKLNENDEYNSPTIMPKVYNQTYHDGPASCTSNGEIVFITRTNKHKRYKKDSLQTHYTFIDIIDLSAEKPESKQFPFNNRLYSVGHAAISPNGKKLIFASDKPGGHGESDLYLSEMIDGEWTEPINLGEEINSFGNEYFPYFENDSKIYFASDGHLGYGGLDLFVSEIKNGRWQTPVNLKAPVNSSFDDFGILILKDKEGIFSSNRPAGKGQDDLYYFKESTTK